MKMTQWRTNDTLSRTHKGNSVRFGKGNMSYDFCPLSQYDTLHILLLNVTLDFYESCTNEFSDIVHLVFILIVAYLQLQCVIGFYSLLKRAIFIHFVSNVGPPGGLGTHTHTQQVSSGSEPQVDSSRSGCSRAAKCKCECGDNRVDGNDPAASSYLPAHQ